MLPQATGVINEFPEYGTTEPRENDTFKASQGCLTEPSQCIEEKRDLPKCNPLVHNDHLTEQCLHEIEKSGSQCLIDCAEENCSKTQELNTPTGCIVIENIEDHPIVQSPEIEEQVEEVMVPGPEDTPYTPNTCIPSVPQDKKSFLYVQRELAAISEEETLSESSLSQITEIADFSRSQHSDISTSTTIMDNNIEVESTVMSIVNKEESNSSAQSQSPLPVCVENAAINGIGTATVQTQLVVGWGDSSQSTADEKQNDTISLIDAGTNRYIPNLDRTSGIMGTSLTSVNQRPRSVSDTCRYQDGFDNDVFVKDPDTSEDNMGHVQTFKR